MGGVTLFILYLLAGVVIAAVLLARLYLAAVGKEKIVAKVENRTPFAVEEQTETSIVLSTKIEFANEGKQCATIMDAFVRPLLPYEQYDGIEARGKAEREGAPREDDYFEAYILQKKGYVRNEERANFIAKVRLTARKGMSLKEALSHMVDVPMDFIWQETGRTPWHYRKFQIILTAEEIASLAGVELVRD